MELVLNFIRSISDPLIIFGIGLAILCLITLVFLIVLVLRVEKNFELIKKQLKIGQAKD